MAEEYWRWALGAVLFLAVLVLLSIHQSILSNLIQGCASHDPVRGVRGWCAGVEVAMMRDRGHIVIVIDVRVDVGECVQ
ncbi:hypothetical protein CVT25_006774 [Psilocybe cyanescens]|uniref:Uncharacterized protein n=1 Tax=Psilocybe cyanescens TaxID=93625 RepID=A0A409X7I9_PSICY|nr:hypothetical protein CVT25_006774 [Psilocybe cyanescens]